MTINLHGRQYVLRRLSDADLNDLEDAALPIRPDRGFQRYLDGIETLDLAATCAVLKLLFGERGRRFDEWKGDFAFPLAIEISGVVRRPAYRLMVVNYRCGVEYRLDRLVEDADPCVLSRRSRYHPPDPDELSGEQVNDFLACFVGFQRGYFEAVADEWDEPFLLAVESNLVLYGFDGERFFEEGFHGDRSYNRRLRELDGLPTSGYLPPAFPPMSCSLRYASEERTPAR